MAPRSRNPSRTRPQASRGEVVEFRRQRASGRRKGRAKGILGQLSPIMVMLPLATFTAVLLWGGPPVSFALPFSGPAAPDRESAQFAKCLGPVRETCVVDGDTFWYQGMKIRIADINTPEVSKPQCPAEAQLGAQATHRLVQLLNAGPFTLESIDRDEDVYGRKLRVVTRGGESLGDALVDEGLAEEWKGYRGEWC